MHRVAGPDTAFLYGERPEWHFHVSAVLLLDPSTAPGPLTLDALADLITRRVHRVPHFRWRLVTAPAGLDHPLFVDDPDFDPARHLRHVAVPAPGDEQAFGRLIGHLTSTRIDRAHPLWEAWLVEGRADGRVALLMKMHHSIVDGVSGAGMMTLLFDLEPDPPPDPPPPPYEPEPAPGTAPRLLDTAVHLATWPWRITRLGAQLVRQGASVVRHAFDDVAPAQPFAAPRTPLNGRLTSSRRFAWVQRDLDEAIRVKEAFGVSVNDVVLAVVGGALRSWLLDRGALPDRPLIAQVPVALRSAHDSGAGTRVGAMFASLATHLDDPADRLRAIHDSTASAKAVRRELDEAHLVNLTDTTPPALIDLAARTYCRLGLEEHGPPAFNLIVSNVPGPPVDLYVLGHRIDALIPMGPLLYGSGLNVTVVSHAGRLDVGLMACPDLVADLDDLAARFGPALDELLAAAGAGHDVPSGHDVEIPTPNP